MKLSGSAVTGTVALTAAGGSGGKINQNPLVLSANSSSVVSGRSVILSMSGGNLPGSQQYAVAPSGNAECYIKTTSNGQTLLKTSGGAGTCSVTVSNPGNEEFNPVILNTIVITVY